MAETEISTGNIQFWLVTKDNGGDTYQVECKQKSSTSANTMNQWVNIPNRYLQLLSLANNCVYSLAKI